MRIAALLVVGHLLIYCCCCRAAAAAYTDFCKQGLGSQREFATSYTFLEGGASRSGFTTLPGSGAPVISFFDTSAGTFNVLSCDSVNCSGNVNIARGVVVNGAFYQSALISSNNLPLFVFGSDGLRVISCTRPNCVTNVFITLDNQGGGPSMVLGSDSLPFIAYYDESLGALKGYHCDSPDCSSGRVRLLDSNTTNNSTSNDVGLHSSVAVGTDNFPIIAYVDSANAALKVFHCLTLSCSSGTALTVYNAVSVGDGLAITISGQLPLIAFHDITNLWLRMYRCTTIDCSAGFSRVFDDNANVGLYVSFTQLQTQLLLAYYDGHDDLIKLFYCDDAECVNGTAVRLPANVTGPISYFFSVTANRISDTPLITYVNRDSYNLALLYCDNDSPAVVMPSPSPSPSAPPSRSSCAGSPPTAICSADAVSSSFCGSGGIWQVTCNNSAPSNANNTSDSAPTNIVITTPTVIVGDVDVTEPTIITTTFSSNSSTTSTPLVRVNGTLTLSANTTRIVIVLTSRPNTSTPLILFEASGGIAVDGPLNISVDDDGITDLSKCEHVVGTPQRSADGVRLEVLFRVERTASSSDSDCAGGGGGGSNSSNSKFPWWIPLAAALSACVVVALVIAVGTVVWVWRRKRRHHRLMVHRHRRGSAGDEGRTRLDSSLVVRGVSRSRVLD